MAIALPEALVNDILAGNCVAFVGAGFSAPANVPTWQRLLIELATSIDEPTVRQIQRLLKTRRLVNYEAAAQILRDKLGDSAYATRLQELVQPDERGVADRRRWLRGIPLRAILTTNFDGLLSGRLPGAAVYRQILRPRNHRWWDERFWRSGDESGPPVVCLHGDLSHDPLSTVLTTRDYRDRLHGNSGYATFLQAVFATNAVLFLGFSFSDFYLNELRAQILSLFRQPMVDGQLHDEELLDDAGQHNPVTAYAVIDNVDDPDVIEYFRKHEGIEIMTYDTSAVGHQPFDDFLQVLYQQTNPQHVLGARLCHRRVLWVDPHPEHNPEAIRYLSDAAKNAGSDFDLVICPEPEDSASFALDVGRARELVRGGGERGPGEILQMAVTMLEQAADERPFDLVISHWGHGTERWPDGSAAPRGQRLLAELHKKQIRVPVIIFAGPDFAEQNRRVALKAGAYAFSYRWPTLCRAIAELFEFERGAF
jgi:hypothetical protein